MWRWLTEASRAGTALGARSTGDCLTPYLPLLYRLAVPISITNPELLRHSKELFMDSGFSPKSQRMGAMVAFQRFEDFTRYPVWLSLPRTPHAQGLSELPLTPTHSLHTQVGVAQTHGTAS